MFATLKIANRVISQELWPVLKNCGKHKTFNKHRVTCHQKRMLSSFEFVKDKYHGIHINLDEKIEENDFEKQLTEYLPKWEESGYTSIWLKVPIERSALIPTAADKGFKFHHAEGHSSMLFLAIAKEAKTRIPRFATHQIGVAGCVVRPDTEEVMVVRDKSRPFTLWKFPGGLSELGEDISVTAVREVYEETGVQSEFQGILTFRQQHNQPGAFGRSDIYFICLLKALTFELNPCSHEIEACQWIGLDELGHSSQNSAITQRVLQLVKMGVKNGFDSVSITSDTFKSVYRGLQYNLFNRTLPKEYSNMQYLHTIADVEGYN